MDASRSWSTTWRYVVGIAVIAVLGYVAFVRGERIPLLGAADLGFHELGHMLLAWAPEKVAVLAGSVTQVAVPLALAAYFLLGRRESVAGALLLAWAGTSAQNVSVYIADAPHELLPLIGGMHDWSFLLRTAGPSWLQASGAIASGVWVLGLLLGLAAMAVCLAGLLRGPIEGRRASAERERLSRLPVREPRNRRSPDGSGSTISDPERCAPQP